MVGVLNCDVWGGDMQGYGVTWWVVVIHEGR